MGEVESGVGEVEACVNGGRIWLGTSNSVWGVEMNLVRVVKCGEGGWELRGRGRESKAWILEGRGRRRVGWSEKALVNDGENEWEAGQARQKGKDDNLPLSTY